MKKMKAWAWLSAILLFLLMQGALAGCGGGSSSPSPSNAQTSAPSAPTVLSVAPGSSQVTIAWSPVAAASSYDIYWSTTPGVPPTAGTKITGATSPYTLTNLTNGTTYYCVVSAVCAGGVSLTSNPISVVPGPSISVVQTADNVFALVASGLDAPAGFDLTINYDGSLLSNPHVAQGTLSSGAMFAVNTNVKGSIRIAVVSHASLQGSGTIANITFDRIGNTYGAINLSGIVINAVGKKINCTLLPWMDSTSPIGNGSIVTGGATIGVPGPVSGPGAVSVPVLGTGLSGSIDAALPGTATQ